MIKREMNMEKKAINFKDIQNFFGDRGYTINKGDFIKWGINDEYIYWIPNNKKCDEYLQSELEDKKMEDTKGK